MFGTIVDSMHVSVLEPEKVFGQPQAVVGASI